MADVKTVTQREIKQITNAICEKPKTILWHGKRIHITPLLSFKDFLNLVGDIMAHCVDDNKIVIEFVDFVFRSKVVEAYGNLKLPDDIETQYSVIYESDLVDVVFNEINKKQLNSLLNIIGCYTGLDLKER